MRVCIHCMKSEVECESHKCLKGFIHKFDKLGIIDL